MIQILGNSFIIVAELPVHWLRTASDKPPTEPTAKAAMYPVWLMDSLSIRAAIFLRCPACNKPMNLFPGTKNEQKEWNAEEPELTTMVGCDNCNGLFFLTRDKAYALAALPPPKPRTTVPRPWDGGVANGNLPVS